MEEFCKQLPKVELHAHLNGSVSSSTIDKLLQLKGIDRESFHLPYINDLKDCFKVFPIVHSLIDSTEALYLVTCDVIEEFSNDGVHYLELRSSPKAFKNCTQQEYVETVLRAIEDCKTKDLPITVTFVLSIDRSFGSKNAAEIVNIVKCLRDDHPDKIVGIDLSGNPATDLSSEFITVLEEAKNSGLKLTLHIAEIEGKDEECLNLLQIPPDRIGHGSFIHTSSEKNLVIKNKIPIEICPTSNLVTATVNSYEDHHFAFWYKLKHPCIICTDDKGVFKTSLSNEFYQISKAFNLSKEEIWDLSFDAINCIFGSEELKERLREEWKKKRSLLFQTAEA